LSSIKIVYVEPDGNRREIDVPVGWNAMDGAIQHDLPGIMAVCGGGLVCATCHVYVDKKFVNKLPKPVPDELDALEAVATERKSNSRLACAIEARPELDGIVLKIPERQL
jgi:2Fe-2S ferredoxin